MVYAGKEVRIEVSNDLFYDLVDRIRKETDAILTVQDIREIRKDLPDLQNFPLGRYHFEFARFNGQYLCTLRCKDPENEEDVEKLKTINDVLRDFEFFPTKLGTFSSARSNPFS